MKSKLKSYISQLSSKCIEETSKIFFYLYKMHEHGIIWSFPQNELIRLCNKYRVKRSTMKKLICKLNYSEM